MTIANPDEPLPPQDPRTRVRMSEQLWSTQVGMAEATAGDGPCARPEISYEFTGRTFNGKRNPYA